VGVGPHVEDEGLVADLEREQGEATRYQHAVELVEYLR
jgi:hypothetical protein